jgi:hypothetical protein
MFEYLNTFHPKFRIAVRIFRKIKAGSLKVSISSVTLVEMELIHRSEGKAAIQALQ